MMEKKSNEQQSPEQQSVEDRIEALRAAYAESATDIAESLASGRKPVAAAADEAGVLFMDQGKCIATLFWFPDVLEGKVPALTDKLPEEFVPAEGPVVDAVYASYAVIRHVTTGRMFKLPVKLVDPRELVRALFLP